MVVGQLTIETDLAVLGGGPAGYIAAIRAADLGKSVTVVDSRDRMGGTCLIEGCIPSKSLIRAVRLIQSARNADHLGISFGEIRTDLDKLRAWKESVVNGLTTGIDMLFKRRGIDIIHGHGHFMSAKQISVEEADVFIEFKNALIAAGSTEPKLPDGFPDGIWSPADALALPEIPARLLVITNQYYGLEIAQIYAGLGSKVTIADFDPSRLPGADHDLIDVLIRAASSRFDAILTDTRVTVVSRNKADFTVHMENLKGSFTADFDRIVMARGRLPNSGDIGLETTGVKIDALGFIQIDNRCRTSVKTIFAAGDITPGPMLEYKAGRQGKVAAEVIAGLPSAYDNRAIPFIVFTDPEIAWTGLTERTAKESNITYKSDRFPLKALGEAHILDQTDGFVKVLYHPDSHTLLGVGIVGPRASEMISEATLAIEMGATLEDLLITMHPHPTMSESLMEAAEVASGQPIHVFQKKK